MPTSKIKIEMDDSCKIVGDEAKLCADIQAALDEVNGRAQSFTINRASKVIEVARKAEQ